MCIDKLYGPREWGPFCFRVPRSRGAFAVSEIIGLGFRVPGSHSFYHPAIAQTLHQVFFAHVREQIGMRLAPSSCWTLCHASYRPVKTRKPKELRYEGRTIDCWNRNGSRLFERFKLRMSQFLTNQADITRSEIAVRYLFASDNALLTTKYLRR